MIVVAGREHADKEYRPDHQLYGNRPGANVIEIEIVDIEFAQRAHGIFECH